jgi:hypothetical protein
MTCPKCQCKMCYICGIQVSDYSHFYGQTAKPSDDKCALYTDTNSLHVKITDENAPSSVEETLVTEPPTTKEPSKITEKANKKPEEIEKQVLGVERSEETTSSTYTPNILPNKKRPGKVCCVVKCFSRAGKDSVSFFRFPKKDIQQRNAWINAINRINHDNTTWTPNDGSRVCSKHFIGGNSSKFQDHPNYTPTLFPTKHVAPKADEDILRFQRVSTQIFHDPDLKVSKKFCSSNFDHFFEHGGGGNYLQFPMEHRKFKIYPTNLGNLKITTIVALSDNKLTILQLKVHLIGGQKSNYSRKSENHY